MGRKGVKFKGNLHGKGVTIRPVHQHMYPKFCQESALVIDREAREIIRLVASVRLSVRPCVCVQTYEIQSKTSVCLSVIKELSQSKSCTQRSGAFNFNSETAKEGKHHDQFMKNNISTALGEKSKI